MTARELFEQLEKLGLADAPLVTNPEEPEQENCWIAWEEITGWVQTSFDVIFLQTEH